MEPLKKTQANRKPILEKKWFSDESQIGLGQNASQIGQTASPDFQNFLGMALVTFAL